CRCLTANLQQSSPQPCPRCTISRGGADQLQNEHSFVCSINNHRARRLTLSSVSCTRFRRHQVRCFMEQEVGHGETEVHARVQARGGEAGQGSWGVVYHSPVGSTSVGAGSSSMRQRSMKWD